MALGASAQQKGRFEVHDFDGFKLHVYYTNDALGDASYIVEGKKTLVTMEQPLFKDKREDWKNWQRLCINNQGRYVPFPAKKRNILGGY